MPIALLACAAALPLAAVPAAAAAAEPETQIDSAPPAFSASPDASIRFSAPASLLPEFECRLDGSDWETCESPRHYSALADGDHAFAVRAVDPLFGGDPTPATADWVVDTVAPTPAISGPPAVTNATTAEFGYGADEPAVTLECDVDMAEQWSGCAPSYAVGEGDHSLRVRATDPAGNVGLASYDWTVDTTAPTVAIGLGTSGTVASRSAAFSFSSADAGASFRCSLDGAPSEECASPKDYSGLSDGAHTFSVTAIDAAGNPSAPATASWRVETDPPPPPLAPAEEPGPEPLPQPEPQPQGDAQPPPPDRTSRRPRTTHVSNERTRTWWSYVRRRSSVRSRPSRKAPRTARIARFTYYGLNDVVVVLKRRGRWTKIRHSGLGRRTGWVRNRVLSRPRLTRTRIVINRKRFTLTAYRRGKRVFRTRVGVGAKGSPTPAGRFFMRERLVPRDKDGIYGALAWGTSTYSRYRTDWPGGGQVGIHGTNQPGLIPGRISNGCVRLRNRAIRRLDRIVRRGTPVRVR